MKIQRRSTKREREKANEVNRNDGNKTEGQGKWDQGGRINETEG